ncbi:MAG TPA: vWA domain-containing protein [Methanothrix sp.]|nr:vWA domain-containing protein [Methanothrix sp.]
MYMGDLKLIGIILITLVSMISCDAQDISVSNNVAYPSDHIIWASDSVNSPREAMVELNVTDLVNKERKPITVVIAIDCSGSMENSDPREDRVKAAKRFVDLMAVDKVNDKFGVVLWNGAIIEKLETTDNIEAVKNSIDNAEASDGTCIWEALNASDSLLQGATTDKKIVVIFSDGYDGCEISRSVEKAREMKSKGITIYTIGLGSSKIADLEAIGQYFHVNNPGGIVSIFEEVVARLKTSLENVEVNYLLPNGIEAYDMSSIPANASLTSSGGITTINWGIGPMYYQQTKTLSFKVRSRYKGTYLLAMPSDSIVSYNVQNIGPGQATIPPTKIEVDMESELFYSARAKGGKVSDEFYPGYRITGSKDIRWSNFGCQDIVINITTPEIPCNRTVVFATDASGSTLHGSYVDSMMVGIEGALRRHPTVQYARVDWDVTATPDYASPTFMMASNWGTELRNNPLVLSETDGTEYAAGLNRAVQMIVNKKNVLDTPFDRRITDYMVVFLTGKSEFAAGSLSSAVQSAALNNIPIYTIGLDIDTRDPATSEEASVLQNDISNPTRGQFIPSGNSISSVEAIVDKILSESCRSREDIPAARSMTVIETVYPYFRVLGTEPNSIIKPPNPDGTTTVIFNLGNVPGAAEKSLVIHTAINFSKLPVDVISQRTKVDFSPDSATPDSVVSYTSMVDNTTRRTKSLPEGELDIFCGEPCYAEKNPAVPMVDRQNTTPVNDTSMTDTPKSEPGFEALFAATVISLAGYLHRRRMH